MKLGKECGILTLQLWSVGYCPSSVLGSLLVSALYIDLQTINRKYHPCVDTILSKAKLIFTYILNLF